MYATNDFKKGLKILYKDQPYVIISFQHVKPGKGNQFTRTKLKNLINGTNIDLTVRSGEKFKIPNIMYKEMTFLYQEGSQYHFMDQKSYEQVSVEKKVIEYETSFLIADMTVTVCLYNEMVISLNLPKSVNLIVQKTDPGFKGNTVSNHVKPATLETGLVVQVPLHINEGDQVRVNTENSTYVERVRQA